MDTASTSSTISISPTAKRNFRIFPTYGMRLSPKYVFLLCISARHYPRVYMKMQCSHQGMSTESHLPVIIPIMMRFKHFMEGLWSIGPRFCFFTCQAIRCISRLMSARIAMFCLLEFLWRLRLAHLSIISNPWTNDPFIC